MIVKGKKVSKLIMDKIVNVSKQIEENIDVSKLELLFGENYSRDEKKHLKEISASILAYGEKCMEKNC